MNWSIVALALYCSIGILWWVYNLLDWFQCSPAQVEDRRVAARYAVLAPIWPAAVLYWVGRTTGRLFVDATRRIEK